MKISSSHQFAPPYISCAAWGVRVRWHWGVGKRAVLLRPFLLQLLGGWRRVWSVSGSGISSQLLFPRLKFSGFWNCESGGGRTFGDGPCLMDVADSLVNTFCSLGATLMQEGLAGPPHRPVSWIQVQILLQSGKSLIETESTPVSNGVQWWKQLELKSRAKVHSSSTIFLPTLLLSFPTRTCGKMMIESYRKMNQGFVKSHCKGPNPRSTIYFLVV